MSSIGFSFTEATDLCTNNGTVNTKLLSITFGSGAAEYSKATPADFNFTAQHIQQFEAPINDGLYAFVNKLPNSPPVTHDGAWDHTPDDNAYGYMYYIAGGMANAKVFNSTRNDLCIGSTYEFSAYLANAVRKNVGPLIAPNILFEVWNIGSSSEIVAKYDTGDISEYDSMTWTRCGLSFNASTSSVNLLIISKVGKGKGNEFVLDDIELQISSGVYPGYCSPGQYLYYS